MGKPYGNGWVDENDNVFFRLTVWTRGMPASALFTLILRHAPPEIDTESGFTVKG